MKRIRRPEKVEEVLSKPTDRVGVPEELKISPVPVREPQVVLRPLRSKRVPAPRFRRERREPALVTPVLMAPAATLKAPVE